MKRRPHTTWSFWALTFLAVAVLASTATGANRTYTAAAGDWDEDTNWTGDAKPTGDDEANIGLDLATCTVDVTLAGEVANNVFVGCSLGQTGTITVSGSGALAVSDYMYVGYVSEGTVIQTGGTVSSVGSIHLGVSDSAQGTYDMSDGSLTVGGDLHMASAAGSGGTLNITGGSVSVAGDIIDGLGSSRINIDGGTLTHGADIAVDGFYVGSISSGEFTQSGQVISAGSVVIGDQVGSEGLFNLDGGLLRAGTLRYSSGDGNGNFVFSGGTLAADEVQFGWLGLQNSGGVLAPGGGDSPGTTNIAADHYVQGPDASFEIEINGYDQGDSSGDGVGYDLVDVDGWAMLLGGYIDVVLLDGFLPNVLDTFDVLRATGEIEIGPGGLEIRYGAGSRGPFVFDIVGPEGGPQVLRLTFTPEPATMAMLAMAAASLGAYIRRRRRI